MDSGATARRAVVRWPEEFPAGPSVRPYPKWHHAEKTANEHEWTRIGEEAISPAAREALFLVPQAQRPSGVRFSFVSIGVYSQFK
jgi:hypothetical protein